jgi:hypothetical protein
MELTAPAQPCERKGQEVSALELCQVCRHLADELARRINALVVTSWLNKPVDVPATNFDASKSENNEPRILFGRCQLGAQLSRVGSPRTGMPTILSFTASSPSKPPD